jgi:hypothetical protein
MGLKDWKTRGIRVLAMGLSLMAVVSPLFAAGSRDPELSQADKLIEAKQYEDALRILTEFTKKNPEKFDLAQRRLQRIVSLRRNYNETAESLLDVVITSPEDAERILTLIDQLENLGSAQNTTTQEFIARTRELAQFRVNRSRLERILVNGRRLLDQADYLGAMRAYAEGLDIYRDEFFRAGYGEMIESRVSSGIEDINSCITIMASLIEPVQASLSTLDMISSQNQPGAARLQGTYRQLQPALDTLVRVKATLMSTARYFDQQLEILQNQRSVRGDRSFLSFAARLILGRTGQPIQEGMLGAAGGLWMEAVTHYERTLASIIDRDYELAYNSALQRAYQLAGSQFLSLSDYPDLPLESIASWNAFREIDGVPASRYFDEPVTAEKMEDFLKYESLRRALPYLRDAESLGQRFSSSLASSENAILALNTAAALQDELVIRRTLAELRESIGALLARLNGEDDLIREAQRDIVRMGSGPPYMNHARSLLIGLDTDIAVMENNAASRRYVLANMELDRRLAQRQTELNSGNALLEGERRENAGVIYDARYPVEALAVFSRMREDLAADLELGAVLIAQYKQEDPELLNSSQMQELYGEARVTISRLEELQDRTRTQTELARNRAAQAEAFRMDGDRLFQEAQSAMAQNNFDTARDRITRAGERYDASLAIEDNPALRAERDTRLVRLGEELNRRENELIIRQVRELVNNAKTTFFAGNFEQAEEMLVRAQNRWRVTNADNNTEVVYWLTIVRGALSLSSGRVIAPTAPLYPEMSQLLSEAKKSYDEGVALLSANRRNEGLVKFTEARRKTEEVKIIFPLNEEAGLLELRMDQVVDPAAFSASFVQRLNTAVTGTKQKSAQAYADLQNLASINPRYPGIRAILNQAEIDMGIRPPPPDPQALARSRELTEAAQEIINANLRPQFEIAREQLKQALELNPDNTPAMAAMDRVQTLIGGGDAVVLSSGVESEYQRAVRELQQGNTINAMAIVQKLLQDPRNHTSKILELQRRIESML